MVSKHKGALAGVVTVHIRALARVDTYMYERTDKLPEISSASRVLEKNVESSVK